MKDVPCTGIYFGKYDVKVILFLCSKERIDFGNSNHLIQFYSRNIEKSCPNSSSVGPNAILTCAVRDTLCSKGLLFKETP